MLSDDAKDRMTTCDRCREPTATGDTFTIGTYDVLLCGDCCTWFLDYLPGVDNKTKPERIPDRAGGEHPL